MKAFIAANASFIGVEQKNKSHNFWPDVLDLFFSSYGCHPYANQKVFWGIDANKWKANCAWETGDLIEV